MTRQRSAPRTRSGLVRNRRRLERVRKGVSLLRRKREALVSELFRLARPAIDARARIVEQSRKAYASLIDAYAVHGGDGLSVLGWPERTVRIEVRAAQVWGVQVAEIVDRPSMRRTVAARGTAPGVVGPSAAEAATDFEQMTELLLDAAPKEMLIDRLGDAIAATSRQVNMLEQRLAPELAWRISMIDRTLEEREREEHVRLRVLIRGKSRVRRPAPGG